MINILIILAMMIVSYFLLRISFKSMNKRDKADAPIGLLIFVLFVPFVNVLVSFVIWFVFYFTVKVTITNKIKLINKVFFLKE